MADKQDNHNPELIKHLNLYHHDAEYRRNFDYLTMHPEEIPQESLNLIADPWKRYTLADAYEDRPPLEYVAEGLFSLPSLNIPYGPPGSLKSFLMADLAICVASGELWLPPKPGDTRVKGIKTKQMPVIWLDFDNGTRMTHDRLGALGRARNLPKDIPLSYYSLPMPWLDAGNPESVGMMIKRIKREQAGFVVIDNLGLVSGGVEENSSQMVGVMAGLKNISEETGAVVNPIHHQRKGGTEKSARAGDSLRGHSSIEAQASLALLITREEGESTITIQSTKTRGVDVYPFGAEFSYEWKPGTKDLYTAKFWGSAVEDTTSSHAIELAIVGALEVEPLNQSNLMAAVKARGITNHMKIHKVIKNMEQSKSIKTTPGKKGSITYELP